MDSAKVHKDGEETMNNRDLKSSIFTFYSLAFEDAESYLPSYEHHLADRDYVLQRLKAEGVAFATRALPDLGKAVEASAVTLQKLVVPHGFNLFGKTRLPVFLHDLLKVVFDDSGNPRFDVRDWHSKEARESAHYYKVVRQITLAFSKVTDCGTNVNEEELEKQFLERISTKVPIAIPSHILCRARRLIKDVVMEGERLHASLAQWESNPFGRHGPGAVAEKEKGPDKWSFQSIRGLPGELYSWSGKEPLRGEASATARLCMVPKDYKSLRAICIEPKELQFAQQGLLQCLVDIIHHSSVIQKSVCFSDQSASRELANSKRVATIDLKDASDTVRKDLCRLLFPRLFWKLVSRVCSRSVLVKGQRYKTTTLATMGNALCFPIETLVFWSLTRATCESYGVTGPIRVFGDDIICPEKAYEHVVRTLTGAGFSVNSRKSCNLTIIRESCGAYYYAGLDVEIVRFLHDRVSSLASWHGTIMQSKRLYEEFFRKTASAILEICDEQYAVPFGYWGFPNTRPCRCKSRYNALLQRAEIRVPVPFKRQVERALPGHASLYAWIVGNATRPSYYGTDKVKSKWVSSDTYPTQGSC